MEHKGITAKIVVKNVKNLLYRVLHLFGDH